MYNDLIRVQNSRCTVEFTRVFDLSHGHHFVAWRVGVQNRSEVGARARHSSAYTMKWYVDAYGTILVDIHSINFESLESNSKTPQMKKAKSLVQNRPNFCFL